jgi:CubicO group peptidase (beta-lactamase class C family)
VAVLPLTKQRLAERRLQAALPALAAASARCGGTINLWVDGERATGTGIAVEDTDLWHLGSISKSMTALLAARLVESGAIGWDETVGDVLQAAAPDMHEAYRPATLRQLLWHRSGLPMNIPAEQYYRFSHDVADAREDRRTYARYALAMAPIRDIGTTFKYSNCGYVVAAAMLETRLDRSWQSLLRTCVFAPLELSTAGLGAPGRVGAIDQPVGHDRGSDGKSLRAYPVGAGVNDIAPVLGPAGRVHMSLPDLVHYLIAHCRRTDVLQQAAWAVLHDPPPGGDYAMGWYVREDGTLWHSGSNGFWYAEAQFNPSTGIVAAAVSNDGYKRKSAPAVGSALLEAAAAA